MQEFLEQFKHSQLFKGINDTDRLAILSCIPHKLIKYTSNETVFNEEDIVNEIGLVLKGSVLLVQEDFFGNRSIFTKILPLELFGEVFAFSGNQPISFKIITSEDSEILFLNFKKMITVCKSACEFHNRLILNLLEIVAKKNIIITDKLHCLSQRSIRDKLLSYLSEECKKQGKQNFTIPFNRQQLADYLSVDRSAMSNELSKMNKEGILDYHKNAFRLIQRK